MGLAQQAPSFAQVAQVCFEELIRVIDLKKTKSSLNDFASIIEWYFLPYFSDRQLETLDSGFAQSGCYVGLITRRIQPMRNMIDEGVFLV